MEWGVRLALASQAEGGEGMKRRKNVACTFVARKSRDTVERRKHGWVRDVLAYSWRKIIADNIHI